jgi:hypothetical protein
MLFYRNGFQKDYLRRVTNEYLEIRFKSYLELRGIYSVINDLNELKLPISNAYVKVFRASIQDRIRSKGSMSTYATVLNGYFLSIKKEISRVKKRTASKYISSPAFQIA